MTINTVEPTIKTLATKDDLAEVRKEMGEGFANLRKEMGENFVSFHKQIGENTARICKEIAEKQENNIKWMFIFWIGQVAATIGTVLLFLKK